MNQQDVAFTQDDEEVTRSIESGEYYEDARAWYLSNFVAPVNQGAFFLVVMAGAALIGLFGVVALLGFLPLSPERPFIYINEDVDEYIPDMVRLRVQGETIDHAVQRFLVQSYVERFERYSHEGFRDDMRYVEANSVADVTQYFRRRMSPNNPRSPLARLGKSGIRNVRIGKPNIMLMGDGMARADLFVATQEIVRGTALEERWQVSVEYMYNMLVKDEKQLEMYLREGNKLKVEDTQFLVTSYEVREL